MSPTMPQIPAPERIKMEKALDVLRERGALVDDRCPECQRTDWQVDFVAITAMPMAPVEPRLPPPPDSTSVVFGIRARTDGYIPACTLTCTTCGYTKFFNLNVLGLAR